jgi:cobalt-zinc-cadmium efflux system protein
LGVIKTRRGALLIALVANAAFLVVELIGGFAFGSLALFADAAHMVSDVFVLGLAYIAMRLALRPATDRHTYGFGRAEVLAALANGVLLLVAAVVVTIEAITRLRTPQSIDGGAVVVVGCLGLIVNVGSAFVLGRHAHGNLNMRGAFLHMLADALGSVAVIIAGVGAAVFGADRLDPIASLFISVLVVAAGWPLVRDSARVLLEAVPNGLDPAQVRAALAAEPGVDAVHHVHLWTTGSEQAALSAHVVLGGALSLHEAQLRAGELKQMLAARFGIEHTTLEVECHECAEDDLHSHPTH